VAGGLEAAFLTDLLQGSFIIVLSIMLLPFMFARINKDFGSVGVVGAFQTMHERLPESFFKIFGSPDAIDFTWYYIGAIMLMVTINVAVGANQLAAMGSAKDEYSARFGFTSGLYLKRVCTILWGLFALAGAVLYAGKVSNPDMMWGYAARDLLAPLGIGLVGLMVASMMAALMSTVSCMMITNSALLTRNVYRVVFPHESDKHYVTVGRLSGAAVAIGGAWMALAAERLLDLLKLNWEFGVIFAASFWMGILWRKSNRKGAWVSILVTLIAFFTLPVLIPLMVPGLRTDAYMTRTTQPRTLERVYTAHEIDVETRNAEIAKWDQLATAGQAQGMRPEPIELGRKFSKLYLLKPKGIFWTQGVKRDPVSGQLTGFGQLSLELWLLDKLGCDLSKNPYALNETIRVLIRILTPFIILILLGYLGRSDDPAKLDRFYAKMKTPARGDRQVDEQELALSYANPHRFDHLKMFPRTAWEFCKWDRTDAVGFALAMLIAFAIIGLLFLVVSIGA
jgi:SSS family solute:Na+ symporter